MMDPGRDLRQKLVTLRNLREGRAIRALQDLHRASEKADAYLRRECRQLEHWRCQAAEEEAAVYAALLAEAVSRRGLERARNKVDALRQRMRALERAVESAREQCDKAQAALRQGQAARVAATKAARKSVEVLNIYRHQCAVVEERCAEETLDEIAVMMHGRAAA